MREIKFTVDGYPPAKNEAKSMLAAGHVYADRVLSLLHAARATIPIGRPRPVFGSARLGLEITLEAPERPPSDATNYRDKEARPRDGMPGGRRPKANMLR